MELSIGLLLAFSSIVICICFGAFLLLVRKSKRANAILAIFFLLFGVIQYVRFMDMTEIDISARIHLPLFLIAFYTLPAIIYFYIKSLSNSPDIKLKWLHLTPGFLVPVLAILFVVSGKGIQKPLTYYVSIFLFSLFIVQSTLYSIKSLKVIKVHEQAIGELYSFEERINLRWMYVFIFGFVFFLMGIFTSELVSNERVVIMFDCIMISYLFFIGAYGLRHVDVFSNGKVDYKEIGGVISKSDNSGESKVDSTDIDRKTPESLKEEEGNKNHKYANSALKDTAKIKEIRKMLEKYMQDEKPYLNPKLSLFMLAKFIGVNYKYLSQVINMEYNQNFISFVNKYRVREAEKLILLKENQSLSVEIIGEMVGFQSKSTFYSYFKKTTGTTPSKYRDSNFE